MAIPSTNTVTVNDNLPVEEEIEFGLGDPRWIMKTQAKLYSDVTTAIIREYSTNARDAHVMAGNDAPIEVTLPDPMGNTNFVVKDNGTGMDIETFRTIYTQFGTSNKRESNDTNGMLGYGSKSGVAYGDSFTVVSVKDGIKISGTVLRRPDWSIVLKVLGRVKTDEPNGTTITIPIHNITEFNAKAQDFYKWWLPGTVLVNGVEPVHAAGSEIIPGLYFSDQWATSYVVMGNVPYRINNPYALFANTRMNHVNFVAYVDNGDVEFTPSREDLEYSDKTKTTLHKIITDFQDKIAAKAQGEIDSAADHAEAYMKYVEWCDRLGESMFRGLTFGGDTLEKTFKINASRYGVHSGRRSNTYRVNDWQVSASKNTMFVTGFTTTLTATHKRKAVAWAEFKGLENVNYILFSSDAKVDSVWIDQSRVFDWERIKKELPKEVREKTLDGTPRRIPGSFDFITKDGMTYEGTLPDGDVLWTPQVGHNQYRIQGALKALDSDAAVVLLTQNRVNKFTRENPSVRPFWGWAREQGAANGVDFLDNDGLDVLSLSDEDKRWLKVLDATKCDDPAFARVKDLVKREDELLADYRAAENMAAQCGAVFKRPELPDSVSITAKYPLLDVMQGRYSWHAPQVVPDTYLYLNAAYAARKDNNV